MMLPCHIVNDLLPSYVEHLTGPETEADIRAHLETCPDCRETAAAMEMEVRAEKAPAPKLDFLKRLRWQQRLGAVLSIVVTLLCMYGLYRLEYCYDLTGTAEMEAVIQERLADVSIYRYPAGAAVDVLETAVVKDRLFVLYRTELDGAFERQGVYEFQRGLLGHYRYRSGWNTAWPLADTDLVKLGRERYLVIYSANEPTGAAALKVLPGYHPAAYDGENVPDPDALTPVYEGAAERSLLKIIPVTEEQVQAGFYGSGSVVYYDTEGRQLDARALAEPYDTGSGGGGGSNAEPWAVYVWCGLTALLGLVMTRYFLAPVEKRKKEKQDP